MKKQRMKRLQRRFFKGFGCMPFLPLPGGGNSNTGNLVRMAMAEPKLFAAVLGVPQLEDIIRGLDHLLIACTSGALLNLDEFEKTCKMLLEDLYDDADLAWNMANPTLHFFLYHVSRIIGYFQQFGLPISTISEEGSEANNKRVRDIRNHHTFQGSLKKQTMQMFVRQIHTSDPEIWSLLLKESKKQKPFPSAIRRLFQNPDDFEFIDDDGEVVFKTAGPVFTSSEEIGSEMEVESVEPQTSSDSDA